MIKWGVFKSPRVILALLGFVGLILYGLCCPENLWWWRYPDRDSWCIACGKHTTNIRTVQYSQSDPGKSVLIRFENQDMRSRGQQISKNIPLWLCDGCKPPETIRDYENHHQVNGGLSGKPPATEFGVIFLAIGLLCYLVIEYRHY